MRAHWCGFFSLFYVLVQDALGLNFSHECNAALGLEEFDIWDYQLTGKSHFIRIILEDGKAIKTDARCARLSNQDCAFCGSSENGQYLQVDLEQDFIITGVATQGFEALSNYYVRSYNFSHSRDGHTWYIFPEVMKGNSDGRSVVKHTFSSPIYAKYIRLYPTANSHGFCVRMELYGCSNSSSALSTTHSTTTLSGANNTTPENVPPTTGTTGASSTENPIIIQSTTDQPVGSGKVLITTPRGKETVNITTQMPRDDSKEHFSITLIILLVALAVVIIIIICLLVWFFNHLQKSKGTYHCNPSKEMESEEEAVKFCAFDL